MIIISDRFIDFWGKMIGSPNLKGVPILFWIIVRENSKPWVIRHEEIHLRQRLELLIVPYEILYLIEWIIRRVFRGTKNANKKTIFEKEAYDNDGYLLYIENRKPYAWFKYYWK